MSEEEVELVWVGFITKDMVTDMSKFDEEVFVDTLNKLLEETCNDFGVGL